VHMQGRIYDPKLGRFLQADSIVQDPLNAQSYNRYTYVFNNPLSLTDPSGYRSVSQNLELYWKPITSIAIAVVTGYYGHLAVQAGTIGVAAAWAAGGGAAIGLVNSGTLRGTVQGAFQGLATFGIGHGIENVYANIGAHMMLGGLVESMNGGDFGHGMLSAGLSKVIGIGVAGMTEGLGNGLGATSFKVAIQAIAGGTVSEATGGDFANGAVSAAMQFAFNELLDPKTREGWSAVFKRWFGITPVDTDTTDATAGTGKMGGQLADNANNASQAIGAGIEAGYKDYVVGKAVGAAAGAGGVLVRRMSRAFTLPSWRKITVNMAHIRDRHTLSGGMFKSSGEWRDFWPENYSEKGMLAAIREAYGNAKIIRSQEGTYLLQGVAKDGTTVQMWFIREMNMINTAWPKF
jgi:hypothetical protein